MNAPGELEPKLLEWSFFFLSFFSTAALEAGLETDDDDEAATSEAEALLMLWLKS